MRWILAAFAMLAASAALAEPAPSARREAVVVAGLEKPAEVVVDAWGIPHVFAQTQHDAFFLQGWNAARDRLWQIDLWRKRGLGRLAASFGPAYAEKDRAARLLLYRGDMASEWAAYGPEAQARATAFTAGINAYVAEVRADARPLPVEFRLTDSAPETWAAEDVVRIRSHGLTRNLASEVARAMVACKAGLEADRLRRKLEPPWTTKVPAGLDPCDVTPDVIKDYDLGTSDVSFALARKTARAGETLAQIEANAEAMGSNNWVIGPSRTASGRPILANDPHRALGVPSLRYIVQLSAPGLNVIGAGEPALPGISTGHNQAIAFGFTIFASDQEDLFVYETNPANPRQYRYRDRWEDMRIVHESLEVKGGGPHEMELAFTRHGPVIFQDPAKHRAFALRSIWFEPGTAAYFSSSGYMTATDWNGFKAAMAGWGSPGENLVFADTKGDIGWIAGARAPKRPNWDGLMPVPGDGRYEWAGFWRSDELPQAFNPPKGWLATANEMNLPAGYPNAERKIGFEWTDRSRIDRISEVLGGDGKATLAGSMALQNDQVSSMAKRLVRLVRPLSSADGELAAGLKLLVGWDGRESADSAAAALFEVWVSGHLGKAVVERVTPAAARAIVGQGSLDAVVSHLEAPDAPARDEILLTSLRAALEEVRSRLGPDMSSWTWGRLHQARFEPAAAALADPALKAQMSVGPLQVGGSASTPGAATYRLRDFSVSAGASYRMVLDVGAWDDSVAINTPGQSGDPFSPQYRDLFALWAGGQYLPLLFSREAVDRNARVVMALTPAP
jgi:penicillin amidase